MNARRRVCGVLWRVPLLLACAGTCTAARAASPALVIHPAGPVVPENLLRIEVAFASAPRVPLSAGHLQLVAADGHVIAGALLDLVLPDAQGRRFTVLLDPGRVKSGVGLNLEMGRALVAGSVVRLVVTHPALALPAVKVWSVGAADVQPPVPGNWRIHAPRSGSRDALVIELDDAISASADRLVAVRAPDGTRVAGRMRIEGEDRVLRFVPASPWRAGGHAVMVHPDLEDAAGNRACAPFEQTRQSAASCESGARLPFRPG